MSPPDEHRLVLEEQSTPTSQPVSALPDEAGKPAELTGMSDRDIDADIPACAVGDHHAARAPRPVA